MSGLSRGTRRCAGGGFFALAVLRPELSYTAERDAIIAAYRATVARYERAGHPPCALCGGPAAEAAYFVLLVENARPVGREPLPLRWEASAACFRCDARPDDELLQAWLERSGYEPEGCAAQH
jgi:hypothetical protein